MNIIERLRRSWAIFTASLNLLRAQPKLLLFPILCGLLSIVIAAFFLAAPAAAVLLQPTGYAISDPAHWNALIEGDAVTKMIHSYGETTVTVGVVGYGIAVYLSSMFIASFSNVAFYHQITRAFAGEKVSLRQGLAFAWSRIVAILMWSLLAGSIGLIIKSIAERMGFIGSLIMRLIGATWSVACVFAIPVLVREDCRNPLKVLRRSVGILRQTWGEALIGYAGIGILSSVVALGIVAFGCCIAITAAVFESMWVAVISCMLLVVIILAFGLIVSVSNEIYRCALYIFASEGEIPAPFTQEMMDAAWKMKKA